MSVDTQVKETEFEDKQTYEEGGAAETQTHANGGDTTEQPDTVVADTTCEAPRQVDENVDQRSAKGCNIARSPAWEGATTDDNGVELICIDDDDDPLVVKVH